MNFQKPHETWTYLVMAAACSTMAADTCRPGFICRSDFFGLKPGWERHAVSAEAICNSKIFVIERSVLSGHFGQHDEGIARRLRNMMGDQLQHTQAHVHNVRRNLQRACR